jgi:hypothetical protein
MNVMDQNVASNSSPTQRCRKETRVVVEVQVGVMLQAAATAANSACVVRAVAAGRMARSGAAGASRWVLNPVVSNE